MAPLLAALLDRFAGQQATVEQVHEIVLAETIYGPSHYKRAVLAKLEKGNSLRW